METAIGPAMIPLTLALLTGMVLLLFKSQRRRGKWIAITSFTCIALLTFAAIRVEDWTATQEGFINATDKKLAKDAGYVSAIEWDKDRTTVLAKLREELNASAEEARKKAAESARAAQEAQAALD